jgi:nucleoside-diphosphate-sugar epimerase
MKVLVTGATGYLGAVAAEALAIRGHQVLGLARSERSANALRKRGIEPVMGDFGDPVNLTNAVHDARPDVVVSTASVGGASGDQAAFARDGEAVRAIREALTDHGGALVFTSGSAVFGVFNGGDATDTVYDEDTRFRHRYSRPHPRACTRCWPPVSGRRWPLASRPNGLS